MIWDSAQPSVEDIMSVVYSIGLKLQLNDVCVCVCLCVYVYVLCVW